jgi:hypothetical protein
MLIPKHNSKRRITRRKDQTIKSIVNLKACGGKMIEIWKDVRDQLMTLKKPKKPLSKKAQ